MKFTSPIAVLSLLAAVEAAQHGHNHHRHVAQDAEPLEKRGGSCQFPSDAGLVAVTPKMLNGGWAMSPDQSCKPGGYCPYACPPGQVSMQWDPDATTYSYPGSMNGGLYCDKSGKIQKPFPDRPYCKDGSGAVGVRNKCKGGDVSFCQTVLPGNEAMLIPTLVQELATLAVPDPEYWCETAAHFYINPPGFDAETACVWGTSSNPYGNWSPYVAGANTDSNGDTFLKIGWNPIYLEPTTPFRNEVPEFGVEIECEGGGCNGLPCKIDPEVNAVNEMIGSSSDGAGGAAFCVVTVPKGEKANIVVFDAGGSGSGGSSSSSSSSSSVSSTAEPSSTSTVQSSSSSSSSSTVSSSTVSSSTTTSTSIAPSTTSAASSSTSTPTPTSTVVPTSTATPTMSPSSGTPSSSFAFSHSPSASASYTYKAQALVETSAQAIAETTQEVKATAVNDDDKSAASSLEVSKLGLIIAVMAAMW